MKVMERHKVSFKQSHQQHKIDTIMKLHKTYVSQLLQNTTRFLSLLLH